MEPTHLHPPVRCRMIDEVLSLIGDKWTIYVVVMLGQGKRRFSELKREVDGISQKMLTVTLRGLERDGYVTRTVHPTIPPRVDYELTELGRDLLVPVRALGDWASRHEARVVDARIRYDTRLAQAAE
ncbi:winged helix-turn-helix transcriptional regulator [Aureimonas pseudogalii]|uniref:DNA-binding HxlR family transcriptional regulator n=1 Tax=Aureimonas pseudogalii TaxID=1744844 RepID=A0A7W6H4H6_9HYPH|nr:helix-turn-helix domain-containing protein [Aureimonas pseudogalii]MBB3998268.1 DNA-binding HxlR family transcriptional regulator [Aureimonas pseudogalii]